MPVGFDQGADRNWRWVFSAALAPFAMPWLSGRKRSASTPWDHLDFPSGYSQFSHLFFRIRGNRDGASAFLGSPQHANESKGQVKTLRSVPRAETMTGRARCAKQKSGQPLGIDEVTSMQSHFPSFGSRGATGQASKNTNTPCWHAELWPRISRDD